MRGRVAIPLAGAAVLGALLWLGGGGLGLGTAARSGDLAGTLAGPASAASGAAAADERPLPPPAVASNVARPATPGPTTPSAADPGSDPSANPAGGGGRRFSVKMGGDVPGPAEDPAAMAARRAARERLGGPLPEGERLAHVTQEGTTLDALPPDGVAALPGTVELTPPDGKPEGAGVTTAVEGRVLDASTGGPVVGARVALFSAFYETQITYDRRLGELGGGTTDVEGRFRFPAVNLDDLHYRGGTGVLLVITHPTVATFTGPPPLPIREGGLNALGDFTLEPAGVVIGGRVVDRTGHPVKGALVTFSPDNPINVPKPQRQVLLRSLPHAETDGDGRYRVAGLRPGKVWLTIHVGVDGVEFKEITLTASRDDVNWTVRVGGVVTGLVTDFAGKPIVGARVDGSGNTTHSLADGTFVLENLNEPGPFPMNIVHHAHYRRTVADVRDGMRELRVELEPLPVALLAVRESAAFQPIAEIELVYEAPKAVLAEIPTSPYRRETSGDFACLLYPGATAVQVFAAGYQTMRIPLSELSGGARREVLLVRTP